MEHIRLVRDGDIAWIRMARGKANALNAAMVAELHAALDEAGPAGAVVLGSENPRFFSGGFDIKEVFAYGPEQMDAHLAAFGSLVRKLRHYPKPVVAAISGHAYAGGAILALACDFRVMADGEGRFAINEIDVGFVLPRAIFRMLADAAGYSMARRMVLTGEPIDPRQAVSAGIVDELVPASELVSKAAELARKLAAKPPAVYREIKWTVLGEDEDFTPRRGT